MSPTNHALCFSLRGCPGSLPHSLLIIAPASFKPPPPDGMLLLVRRLESGKQDGAVSAKAHRVAV